MSWAFQASACRCIRTFTAAASRAGAAIADVANEAATHTVNTRFMLSPSLVRHTFATLAALATIVVCLRVGEIGMLRAKTIALIGAVASVGLLMSCRNGSATDADAKVSSANLFNSDTDISGSKGDETYADYDTRREETPSPGEVGGFGCTQDCSGHDAGYQWAEEHSVTEESECGGNSWSFQEGCVAYAQEQEADERDEQADGDDSDDG